MEHRKNAELSPFGSVKYNPDKTHFEQFLQYLGFEGNPDVSYQEVKEGIYNLMRKNYPNLSQQDLVLKLEPLFLSHHDMHCYERYIRDGKKNYKISKDFGEALAQASLDISCKYIPKKNYAYSIEFHKDAKIPSVFGEPNVFYHSCYVSIEDCDTEYDKQKGYLKRIMLCFPAYLGGSDYYSTYDFVNLVFKDDNQTVTEALLDSSRRIESQDLNEEGRKVAKYITNIILYINSGDPDLREIKKPKIPKDTKNPRKFEKKNRHRSLLDLIEVGFNYLKGINYTVSSTVVRGHFRWQPCGTGREQVKLIWIEEHARNFKNS